MTAVPFDTLALARKLEAAGFDSKQAQDTAAALAEVFTEQIVIKRDLKELEVALRADLKELEVTLRAQIAAMEQRLTLRLGAMLAAAVGVVAALVKLL